MHFKWINMSRTVQDSDAYSWKFLFRLNTFSPWHFNLTGWLLFKSNQGGGNVRKMSEKEMVGCEEMHTRTHAHASISVQAHTHTHPHAVKDRGELTAGGGRPLSLDASGYFRRMFKVFCLLPVSPLSTYPSRCSCGRAKEYFYSFVNSSVFFSFLYVCSQFTAFCATKWQKGLPSI